MLLKVGTSTAISVLFILVYMHLSRNMMYAGASLAGNAMLHISLQKELLNISTHRVRAASILNYIYKMPLGVLLLYKRPPLVLRSGNPADLWMGRVNVGRAGERGHLVRELERQSNMAVEGQAVILWCWSLSTKWEQQGKSGIIENHVIWR